MKRLLAILTSIFLISTFLTGCGQMSLYSEPDASYKIVTDVPGISFAVPSVISQATAINRISSEIEFDPDTTYSYKDGTSRYIVFNMENIVLLVEKGTDFKFDMVEEGDDKSQGLNNSSVNGTWMGKTGKNFSYSEGLDDGVYKLIADVTAEVSITKRIYGDFIGELAVVTDGTTEYALFVGVPENIYDDVVGQAGNVIETVAKSLKMTYVEERKAEDTDMPDEAASIAEIEEAINDTRSDASESATIVDTIIPSMESSKEIDEEVENSTESASEAASDIEEDVIVIDEAVDEVSTESSTEVLIEASTASSSEEMVESSEEEKMDLEKNDVLKDEEGNLHLDNQKIANKATDESYFSSIYSALSIGAKGKYSVLSGKSTAEYADIVITRHYGQEEAIELIKEYCNSASAIYDYVEAPTGTHWEAVEYTLYKEGIEKDIYTNIKFTGLDGEKLYFKGIGYSTRTYDINYKVVKEGATESGYICYFAVPNGCNEYMLVVGDAKEDMGVSVYNAYYLIKTE